MEPGTAHTDESLLMFLGRQADEQTRDVLSQIRRRQPYRRVAVLSKAVNEARYQGLYHRIRTFRLEESYQQTEDFRKSFEERLLSALIEQFELRSVAVLPGGNTREQAVERIQSTHPFALIDVPIKATSNRSRAETLLYVPEDVTGVHARTNVFPTPKELVVDLEGPAFDMDIGKIRVYVHPLWSDVVARHLSDEQIIELL
ncbi:MAG: hypothetical protein H0W69_03670 [Gemmatimonadaceae bacterium]|nr:hypothetical protein [Gemmatimonadaceae bacterium]